MHTCSVSWIEIDGRNYKQGAVVSLESDLLPLFAIIEDIVLYNSTTVLFVVQLLVTDCFNSHFHSYEVLPSYPLQFVACEYTDFKDAHVLHHYKLSSKPDLLYIPMKYHIIENI